MLNRYIGNKKAILKPIIDHIKMNVPVGGRVCDAFSGSLAVSLELKKEGYVVSTNDINLFSHFYGRHLIEQCEIPDLDLSLFDIFNINEYADQAQSYIEKNLKNSESYKFLNNDINCEKFKKIVAVYLYLDNLTNSPIPETRDSYFFDTYTEEGKDSYFESQRGTSGNRKFFTPSNGLKLDLIMNQIRAWRKSGALREGVFFYTLTCSVIDALEKVSNTQGTYHDFPRVNYDSRALNELKLIPPSYEDIISEQRNHIIGKAEDSIEFVSRLPEQDLLYLDPPYNFRQYTSYYFLPNVICEYSDIDDLSSYFSNVQFVRGQNMANDFTSTFSKKNLFIDSLKNLISNIDTSSVLMSYFDGRNHWNNTKEENDHKGKEVLLDFFNSELFQKESTELIPFERLNYQSYGGHKAKYVKEFLFSGVKAQ